MINRYNEFIIENLLSRLDESVIYYSDEFVETLKRIKSDVATKLLAMNSKDENTDINYIDVTDSSDQLSFIPDAKTNELLPKPIDKWWKRAVIINPSRAFTSSDEIFKKMNIDSTNLPPHEIGTKGWAKEVVLKLSKRYSNKEISVIHFKSDDGTDSVYAFDDNDPAIKYVDPHSELTKATKGRNPIKIGRLVKRLLQIGGYTPTDKEIEDFVNKYKAQYQILKDQYRNFKMVKGEDIRTYYSEDNYVSKDGGALGNSCMKYDSCQTYFQIYIENPNQVKMLILVDPISEKIKGRALIWNVELVGENDSEKITFMDRIYTNEDSDVIQFTNYATEQGWYFKQLQQSTELFNLCGKKDVQDATLKVSFENFKEYWEFPYMDSLKFLNPDTHQASNKKNIVADYGETAWKLEAQDGTNGICKYCNNTQAIVCSTCDGDGDKPCVDCDGTGETDCYFCGETGKVECDSCSGSGELNGKKCSNCDGTGQATCSNCEGSTRLSCDTCSGEGTVDCSVCHGDGDFDCPECT